MLELRTILALSVLAVLLTPTAVASASVESPVLVVDIVDGYGHDCTPNARGICAANVTNQGQPGNWTIHTEQKIAYIGAATNFSIERHFLGNAWVVPDENTTAHGGDFAVDDPLVPLATTTYNSIPLNYPGKNLVGIFMTPAAAGVYYWGPSAYDPTGPSGYHSSLNLTYDGPTGPIEFARLGPFNAQAAPGTSSLDQWNSANPGLCKFDQSAPQCYAIVGGANNEMENVTPNVALGLDWYDLQVATDPSNLTPPQEPTPKESRGHDPTHGHNPNATTEGHPARSGSSEAPPNTTAPGQAGGAPTTHGPPIHVETFGKSMIPSGAPPRPPPFLPLLIAIAGGIACLAVVLGSFLYSRFHKPSDALASPRRIRITQLARERPGITVGELCAELGVRKSSVLHHLAILERACLVQVVRRARVRIYPPDAVAPSDAQPDEVADHPLRVVILQALGGSPDGLTRRELKKIARTAPSRTCDYNARRLIELGFVEEVFGPGETRLRLVRRT